jgi:hypothetical protein
MYIYCRSKTTLYSIKFERYYTVSTVQQICIRAGRLHIPTGCPYYFRKENMIVVSRSYLLLKNGPSTFAIVNINKQCHWTFVAKERQIISVPDPWHFGRNMDADPDPPIRTFGLWLTDPDADPTPDPGMRIRLRILLFSSVTFKVPTKNIFFSLSFYAYSF